MHLSKVKIKNFRNLSEFDIELSEGLNVIVGENNIGKSTFFDAIRLAVGYQSTLDPVRPSIDDLTLAPDGTRSLGPIEIDLTFSDLSSDQLAEFVEILIPNPTNIAKSDAKICYRGTIGEDQRILSKRYGANREDDGSIPEEVLLSIQVTFLTAMRDALQALNPGRASRLARLLIANSTPEEKAEIEGIFETANDSLSEKIVISNSEAKLNTALTGATGDEFSQQVKIRASEPKFESIARNLRLVLKFIGASTDDLTYELRQNGLGYNNLLYIATVLAELEVTSNANLPIFLVEEPEAHLHPQLQDVLIGFLESGLSNPAKKIQILVASHSPNIASRIAIDKINVIKRNSSAIPKAISLKKLNLDPPKARQLQRMLDVTKASIFFAKGIIFVEGITEAILIPILAKRLGISLEKKHISVIPIGGVDFGTILSLFSTNGIPIRVAVITDGDPLVENNTNAESEEPKWKTDFPAGYSTNVYPRCARTTSLLDSVGTSTNVKVFTSNVTLEFDLTNAGNNNPKVVFDAWKTLFTGAQSVINSGIIDGTEPTKRKALEVWRGICRSSTTKSKPEFIQALSDKLISKTDDVLTIPLNEFEIPQYLKEAIEHVSQ